MKKHFYVVLLLLIVTIFIMEIKFLSAEQNRETNSVKLIQLKYTKAKEMKTMLETFLPGIKIYPDEIRNAVQIYDTPAMIDEAQYIINANDVPYNQAIITLQAVEISYSKSKQIGIGLANYSWDVPTLLPPAGKELSKEDVANLFPGRVYFEGKKADVDIKANPKILVVNNQKATFGAGDRIPLEITQQQVVEGQIAQTTAIQFEEVGVKVQVTPYIFEKENEVLIDIVGEVSSVGEITSQGYPQIITRNIETSIRVKDGWTAVIGGLLKEEKRNTYIGVPLLMDMPLIGYIFKKAKLEKTITEVQLYIKPLIVNSDTFIPPKVK